jgi:hypothetical protein
MIIARTVWGANPRSLPKATMRLPALRVWIHHSVTTITGDVYGDMRAIEAVGMRRFGQFPYSYVIHPRAGEVLEGCGIFRGAHTAGDNSRSFGICWAGNYEDRAPKAQQFDATRWLIAELRRRGHLVAHAPVAGHRDAAATACPGSKLYGMLDLIRHPWEETVPDNPDIPNLPDIKFFVPIVNASTGECRGYYIVSADGQLHAFGPGAPYLGRSEVPS